MSAVYVCICFCVWRWVLAKKARLEAEIYGLKAQVVALCGAPHVSEMQRRQQEEQVQQEDEGDDEYEGQAPQHGRITLAATRRRAEAVAAASRTVSMFEGSLLSWSRWLLVLAVRTPYSTAR